MEFLNYYLDAFRKYNKTQGRATRKDYWMFVLINMLVGYVLGFVENILGMESGFVSSLYTLAVICPNICLCTRRLHDVDKSGWWQLAIMVPFLNIYVLYLLWIKPGTPGSNRFGAPVAAAAAAAAEPVYGEYSVPAEEPKPETESAAYVPQLTNEFSSYEMCPVPKAAKCEYCCEKLEDGAKFCSECGAPVKK